MVVVGQQMLKVHEANLRCNKKHFSTAVEQDCTMHQSNVQYEEKRLIIL